jgi:hypothetical protein
LALSSLRQPEEYGQKSGETVRFSGRLGVGSGNHVRLSRRFRVGPCDHTWLRSGT